MSPNMLRRFYFAPAGIQNGGHGAVNGVKSYINQKMIFLRCLAHLEPKCPKLNIMSSGEQVDDWV